MTDAPIGTDTCATLNMDAPHILIFEDGGKITTRTKTPPVMSANEALAWMRKMRTALDAEIKAGEDWHSGAHIEKNHPHLSRINQNRMRMRRAKIANVGRP